MLLLDRMKNSILVAPYLQKSSKKQIIHGIMEIVPIQHMIPEDNLDY